MQATQQHTFPCNPREGEVFGDWVFQCGQWRCTCDGGTASGFEPPRTFLVSVGSRSPAFPRTGQLWWNGRTLRVWSPGWRDVVGDPGNMFGVLTRYFLPLLGGKLQGPLLLHGDATADLEPVTLRQMQQAIKEALATEPTP